MDGGGVGDLASCSLRDVVEQSGNNLICKKICFRFRLFLIVPGTDWKQGLFLVISAGNEPCFQLGNREMMRQHAFLFTKKVISTISAKRSNLWGKS